MRYLFVFLLVGLVSCGGGDATGGATTANKANNNRHINENTDWTKILNCDDIDGVVATYSYLSKKRGREVRQRELSKFSGYVKYCREDGGLNYLVGYSNGTIVSIRDYETRNNLRFLEQELLNLDNDVQCRRFYRVYKGNPYLYEERFKKNGKPYGTTREWAEDYDDHPLAREATFDENGNPIKDTRWRVNGELFKLYEFSSPGTYSLKKWHRNGQLMSKAKYKDGNRISYKMWREDGTAMN